MTIAEAERFYKQDTKNYEIEKNVVLHDADIYIRIRDVDGKTTNIKRIKRWNSNEEYN